MVQRYRARTYVAENTEKNIDHRVRGTDAALDPDCSRFISQKILVDDGMLQLTYGPGERMRRHSNGQVPNTGSQALTGQRWEKEGQKAEKDVVRAHDDAREMWRRSSILDALPSSKELASSFVGIQWEFASSKISMEELES